MITNYGEALNIAKDRAKRSRTIIYIVETENGYIIVSQVMLPQLSEQYSHFRIVHTEGV